MAFAVLPPEVSELQHSSNILIATFRPTECLIGRALFLPHAVRPDDGRRMRPRPLNKHFLEVTGVLFQPPATKEVKL